jgi:hypothetical protein
MKTKISHSANHSLTLNYRRIIQILVLLLLLISVNGSYATAYYSRTSGNWNDPATWWTQASGSIINSGTYPGSGDIANIMDGHTITITNHESCAQLNIGDGKSGILQFGSGGNYTLSVLGDIFINVNAMFQYASNSGKAHNIILKGNFINNGIVNFCYDGDDYVSITFRGGGTSIVSGTGRWFSLAYMTLDKNDKADIVIINSPGFGYALTRGASLLMVPHTIGFNPPVIFMTGTFRYNITDNLSNLIDPGVKKIPVFTINPDVIIQIDHGSLDLARCPGLETRGYCRLQGQLVINAGTVTISKDISSHDLGGLFYSSNTASLPKLVMNGGAIDCYGAFAPETANYDEIGFTMTGGTFTVNMGASYNDFETFWITDRPGCSVDFSGGTVVIQKKSTYKMSMTNSDFDIGGSRTGKFNVSNKATVQFGNEFTTASQAMRFAAYSSVVYPHIVLFNPGKGRSITLMPYNNSDYNFLSLYINEDQVFENRDVMTASDDHVMTITSDNELFSIYNDGTIMVKKGTVKFAGKSSQSVGGLALDFTK